MFASLQEAKKMITYTFALSFVGVFGMIILKVYENGRRRRIFISQALSRFDVRVQEQIEKMRFTIERYSNKVNVLVREDIPRYSRYSFFVAKRTVMEKYDNLLPNLRGNRILRKNGDVSSFLKDIAKHKQERGGGRIEDESII